MSIKKLSDHKVADKETTHLLNLWFAIMSNRPPREYVAATNQGRADFYRTVCEEIDRRIPKPTARPRR